MVAELIDYTKRPVAPQALFNDVCETLSGWLPAGDDATALAGWRKAHWLVAEWLTYWQNALPWFVERLKQANATVPKPIWQRLLQVDRDCRQRTAQQLDDLAQIVAELQKREIAVLPLKGAVLAPCYYPDPLIRPLGDLDLFVERHHSETVSLILLSLGYRFVKATAKDRVYLIGERNRRHVWDPGNVRPIEVQTQPLNEYGGLAYDMRDLLRDHAETRPIWNGVCGQTPDLISMMHHVAAHATEDWLMRRGKLMQIADIRVLAERMTIADWQRLLGQIPAHGSRFVYPALLLINRHSPVDVPEFVLQQLRLGTPARLRDWLDGVRFGALFEQHEQNQAWQELAIGRMLARSPADQARIMLRLLFPPRHHFRLKPYARLMQRPYWPLAYLPLNVSRLQQLLRRKIRT